MLPIEEYPLDEHDGAIRIVPYEDMKPGESVFVPAEIAQTRSRSFWGCQATYYGKKLGKRFSVRKIDGGYRIFCTGADD